MTEPSAGRRSAGRRSAGQGGAGQGSAGQGSAGQGSADWLDHLASDLDQMLASADAALTASYPGDRPGRQPVHTAYVPADAFGPDTAALWGEAALAALAEFAPGAAGLAEATGIDPAMAARVRPLVEAKLAAEPVEDLRIDFEDGYGSRGDVAEDVHARSAARSLAQALREGTAPAQFGIRCKSLEPATRRRALRTIGVFLDVLLDGGKPLPPGLVITLPKVTSVAQVSAMAALCERFEVAHGPLADGSPAPGSPAPGRLEFEVQVEAPQLILGQDGAATIAKCVHAAGGRLTGLHYGTYDYSAALGVAPAYQSMDHPVADHARAVMQVAVAGTGVRLSDGSSNVLPVGDAAAVTAAWRQHAALVRRSLERGFYQGWDLHPAQLVSRYAATYAFFRESLTTACDRLNAYLTRADNPEEPATARALAGYLLRGLACGAFTRTELAGLTNLDHAQLQSLSRTGTVPDPASP